jgi:hypothetical protein
MNARDALIETRVRRRISTFERRNGELDGLADSAARDVFVHQVIESVHRIEFVRKVLARDVSRYRADPTSELFDPLRAAIWHARAGDNDEALWLIFLFVHFGKHRTGGWRYAREVYGRVGHGGAWTWRAVAADVSGFRRWLRANETFIKRRVPAGGFGNHRKYQSLSATSATGTGAAVGSFVEWVGSQRSPADKLREVVDASPNSRAAFRRLFQDLDHVVGFGRTAKFDYLTMVGKTELAAIEPDSTYLLGATGPKAGAKLLFGARAEKRVADLQHQTDHFAEGLGDGFQVAEDALCNWQKSPTRFIAFRG